MNLKKWGVFAGGFVALVAVSLLLLANRKMIAPWIPVPHPPSPPQLASPSPSSSLSEGLCQAIYHSVCEANGVISDPTGSVATDRQGELEAFQIYETILKNHPSWNSSQIDEELARQIYTDRRRKRVIEVYAWVNAQMEEWIDRQPDPVFTDLEKRQLKTRVHSVQLQLPPPASLYQDEPDLFTKNEVFYERMLQGETRMRVGGAYLFTAKSRFNMIFTMAHELAHSIDPCELRSARIAIPAYDRLGACFVREGLVTLRASRLECGENDQLSETFADWVAVQITAVALRDAQKTYDGASFAHSVINSVKDLCEQEDADLIDIRLHPSPRVRIEKIFGNAPVIREVLGCAPAEKPRDACGFTDQKGLKSP